ncbi:MAG: cation diffusion facilitator family transporter [Chloroherpetonaceae bacterium]|nr:cation diffusion facilitator family transporter [Chloroherpetonaceae bacterium]MCS7212264.1 cation diffusion facilitator family transporter [Chloroherpetonaceae bacterium]MDW8018817.1 cation diffusion facilitator family transporter [Chloroherpetonaceae bacterium]MDW8467256.1 cation diffusion facilitator family transporter [Chloroherpetonaceae bacterium]
MEHNQAIYLRRLEIGKSAQQSLAVATAITTSIFLMELVGGFLSGSLALLADAGHMATDVLALGLGWVAIWFAKKPATPERTYGYYRVEILAALANGTLLCALSLVICYEAILRFSEPKDISLEQMMGFGAAGLLANLASACLLHKSSKASVNVRAAYLHVLSDLLGSVGVVIGALVMRLTGWLVVDPLISLLIAGLIVRSAWGVVVEAVDVLLESVPKEVNFAEVETALRRMEYVRDLHDLHIWSITSGVNALSCHIVVERYDCSERLILAINKMLKERFGIEHVTIQLETAKVQSEIRHRSIAESVAARERKPCHSHHSH